MKLIRRKSEWVRNMKFFEKRKANFLLKWRTYFGKSIQLKTFQ